MSKNLETVRKDRGIFSIPEVIQRSAEDFASSKALSIFRKGSYQDFTYAEVGKLVKHIAFGLKSLGFPYKEKCAILGPNSPEWGLAYLGVLSAGGICIPIDSLLKHYEVFHILKETKVKWIFLSIKYLDDILEIDEDLNQIKHIIVFESEIDIKSKKVITLEELIFKGEKKPKKLSFPDVSEVAVIIYTSGTTGRAKGVMLTHKNIISDVSACYKSLPIYETDRFLSVLPMHHTFECTAGFLLPLYSGAHITFARSLKSRDILEDLKNSRTTVMLGVPLLFQKLYERIMKGIEKVSFPKKALIRSFLKVVDFSSKFGMEEKFARNLFKNLREKAGLSSLRFFVCGGAPLPSYLPKAFRKFGIKLIQGYGLTEASPVLTVNHPDNPVDESVGLPLPEVKVKVRNFDSEGIGELCFKGPMIMKGYYQNPAATKNAFDEEGFLCTGDLGYVDENGYVYICGRAKNVIVTPSGKNVYPEEIENEINKSPYILESVVFGFPTEGGEEVWAVIVPDYESIEKDFPLKELNEDQIEKIISQEIKKYTQNLAMFKRIKKFVIRDEEFPKTTTRKVKRHLVVPKLIADLKKS